MIKSRNDGVHSAPAQIFSSFLSSIIPNRFFAGMAIFAGLFSFGITSLEAANFNSGNLAVIVAASSTANNTTASVIELSSSTASQANPVQTITIDGNSYRVSGSATSTLYLANSADGSLIALTTQKGASTTSGSNANTLTSRGVVTINNAGSVANPASWTGTSGQQTRGASSLNNTTWFIGDQNGFYTDGAASVSPSGNVRGVKAFGSAVYAMTSSASAPHVGIISAATGGTYTALTGLPNGTTAGQDFYLIQSGSNGTTYDVLYILSATSATAGTIAKYSLVSGTWTANGTYTTTFGGFGLAVKKSGSGADLFVTSGTGATAANVLYKLTDTAGFNASIAITTANNVSLYTTAAGTTMKGVAFAPVVAAATPTITGATTATAFTTTYGTASTAQSFSISGSNLTADLVATAATGFEVSSDGTTYDTTATFTQSRGSAGGSLRVRLKANAAVSGSYNAQNIVLSSTGATSVNIVTASTGNAVTAKGLTITANDQTVSAGSALANVTGSTSFTSSGLVNSETIGSVSLSFGGNGASAGTFAGAIVPSAATGGTFTAGNYSISYVAGTLNVSAAAVPTISTGGTLSSLSTTYGTDSTSTSFTVSGADMTAAITVTPPSGFEVSTDDTTFASSVTVGAAGTIGSTTVYVRLSSSATAGTKTGNISLTSSGATAVNVAVISSTVVAKSITGSFTAANKSYDGSTSASVTGRSLTGVVGGDDVFLTGGTAAFDTAGAGTGKTVTLAGAALSGTAMNNYTLASVSTTTADIAKANQTITFNTLPVVSNDFNLSASSSSGLSVSFASSNPGVATVSGNAVTLVGVGTTTITASQVGNENYEAATSVTQELTVSSVPYRLVAGDIAVIGYNTNGTPDSFTILVLKDLNPGTTFYVNDNETSAGGSSFTDLAEAEASFTVKPGQTIAAGTVITLPWGAAAVSDTKYDWSSTSGAGFGNNNEEIFIYTASSITATTPTAFIYGVKIGSSSQAAPSGLIDGNTFIKPSGAAARYKTSGAVYAGPAETLLPAIGNMANWQAVAPGATTDWNFNTQYLLPVIGGLSPSSVLPGGTDFNLVINGSNFYTTTQVTLAGVSKTVTYVNSGQLTIPVTAAEIASAGSLAVVVTNPTPGGGSASQSLAVNSGPSLALTPPADNSAFATTIQTATASRTFKVSGSNLTTGITVTAPTGFEVSSDDASYSSSLLLTRTGGAVAETTLYLRFNPTAVQSYSGNVTAATEGVTPSAAFAVLGNSAAPNEGKLTGTFADGSVALTGTAPTAGTVTEYIVLAKVGSPITDVPSGDASSYTASATYGSGTKIGDSYVVYKGSTPPSSYQVTGLTNRLRYYFSMYSRVDTAYSTANSVNGFPFGVLSNVITQWNFNSPSDDANTATGSFTPSLGSGSFSGAGTITTASFITGAGSTDSVSSDNSGAQTGTAAAYPSSNVGSGTSGVAFSVSTVGKQNIVVYWDVRHSNTSSRYLQFQYSKDGGTTWTNYSATGDLTDSGYYLGNTGDTWFLQRKADLSGDTGVNNNANFVFRIVTVFAPGTSAYTAAAAGSNYGTTGTLRYDMVTVTGVDVSQAQGTTYSEWLQGQGATPSDANTALLEYVYGAKTLGALDPSLKPTLAIVAPTVGTGSTTQTLVLTYYVRQGTSGLTVTPKTSADLAASPTDWVTAGITLSEGAITTVNGVSVQQRTASVPVSGDKKFLKVEAVQQ